MRVTECGYCGRVLDNRFNRDTHMDACPKKKPRLAAPITSFFAPRAPALAPAPAPAPAVQAVQAAQPPQEPAHAEAAPAAVASPEADGAHAEEVEVQGK